MALMWLRKLAGVVGLALAGAMLLAGCNAAQEELIRGVLENVDSVSGEVTVTLDDGRTITVNLADVGLDTLDATAGGATLDSGDAITIEVGDDDQPRALKAHKAKVEGPITALDAGARTLSVEAGNGETITLSITAQTEFEGEDGVGEDFASLSVGLRVEAKYDIETLDVLNLEVEGDDKDDDDEIKGTIVAIDLAATTFTIAARDGTEHTYGVGPPTRIEDDGDITFGDLGIGDFVQVKYVPATLVALKIEVENEERDEEDEEDDEDDEDEEDEEDDDE